MVLNWFQAICKEYMCSFAAQIFTKGDLSRIALILCAYGSLKSAMLKFPAVHVIEFRAVYVSMA